MQKDLSVALFKKFEQCKKTVYTDVAIPDGPPSESEEYKQEIESTVRQRVRVLRARIPHLDYAEACERKSRINLAINIFILLILIILTIFLPLHFKIVTLILIAFIVVEICLSNRQDRVILTKKARFDCPNFDLDREVENDIQREINARS